MAGLRQVPYSSSNLRKALSVQMQKRPTWPPGASLRRFSLFTFCSVIPVQTGVFPIRLSATTVQTKILETVKRTWDVSESLSDTGVLIVDDAGPSALDTPAVSHLTLTSTHALGSIHLESGNNKSLKLQWEDCNGSPTLYLQVNWFNVLENDASA